ncbi:hypothetical protein MASR2M78_23210 [Treponema sp.]
MIIKASLEKRITLLTLPLDQIVYNPVRNLVVEKGHWKLQNPSLLRTIPALGLRFWKRWRN